MPPRPIPLKFQIGARTLARIPRTLVRIPLSLNDVLAGRTPELPPTGKADGYLVTSLPATQTITAPGFQTHVRQRYVRYHTDLTTGADAWLAGLSGATRSTLKRKAKKLATASGGTLDIRRYATAEEFAVFHPLARRVSATTYQEKLLDAGLPTDPAALAARAAAGELRAWLLFIADEPVAYLCCTAQGSALRYDYVGHDPAAGDLSPGTVLQVEAMRDLFAEARFARFDFTEGEGQHKRQLASGGTPCVDLLLLCPTVANRMLLAALAAFDRVAAAAKRSPLLKTIADRIRRPN